MPLFNCACDDGLPTATLSSLRDRLMVRLGYGAQVANKPPGMQLLLDDFLFSSQTLLYARYPALHTERFFSWTLTIGEGYYGMTANDEQTAAPPDLCIKTLSEFKAPSGVWLEDLNGTWLPMREGIDPLNYTSSSSNGVPSRYEIRQCIEVFPRPSAAYKLWIKGHFGLLAFAADGDTTTLDSELVFSLALANAKAHYGQADARSVFTQVSSYLQSLNAHSHGTARYIPGVRERVNIPQPILVP